VTLISSHNAVTPASLIEAMAASCPVIAIRVSEVHDMISDGEKGRLLRPSNREALAEALLALFREPERTTRMAELARQRVLEQLHGKRLIADVDWLYRDVPITAGHPQPAALSGTGGAAEA
jgi:glycosyltransferase involved in cell wall biosynthesis